MKRRRETITPARVEIDTRFVHVEPVLDRAEAAARRRALSDAEALLAQAAAMSAVLFGCTAMVPPAGARRASAPLSAACTGIAISSRSSRMPRTSNSMRSTRPMPSFGRPDLTMRC